MHLKWVIDVERLGVNLKARRGRLERTNDQWEVFDRIGKNCGFGVLRKRVQRGGDWVTHSLEESLCAQKPN